MSSMDIAAEIRATHEDLSAEAALFLDYVQRDPERARPIAKAFLPEKVVQYKYPFQAWPTFVGGGKLAAIKRATIVTTALVKSVPERIFGNDPKRIAEYYRLSELMASLLLEPPNGIAGAIARCDFFDSAAGFKCLEVNLDANLGGWQTCFWGDSYCKTPVVARFLAEHRITPLTRDPLRCLLLHVVQDSLGRSISLGGELNVALVVTLEETGQQLGGFEDELRTLYSEVVRQHGRGLAGTLVLTSYESLSARGELIYHGRLPIHAVIEATTVVTPREVYRCFKSGRISLYNSPVSVILADKRNLALLSSHEESDAFDAAERALIREHIPWSRETVDEKVTYRGERVCLTDLLIARREDFVVKRCDGFRGEDVYVGRYTAPESWRQQVHRAAATRGWLAQEFVDSKLYLYQRGDSGYARHRVVWGLFCFGSSYGGGFLRMVPAGGGDGIINSARGATEGLIFEV